MYTSKMVIVIRKDLNMRKGKMIAQAGHAVLGAFLNHFSVNETLTGEYQYYTYDNEILKNWINFYQTKICVYVNSENELLELYNQCIDNEINAYLVHDAGLTEFNNTPTITCLAIGPDITDDIDAITGHLPLL